MMIYFIRFVALFLSVISLFTSRVEAHELNPSHKQQIEEWIRNYILQNPQVIIESLEKLQESKEAREERERREAIAQNHTALYEDPNTPVSSNLQGDITIVEFFDYACGYCKRVLSDLDQLLQQDGNIRIVLKEFPILGESSILAARSALVVWKNAPQLYWDFHYALMNHRGQLTHEVINQIASSLGINGDDLARKRSSPEITKMIRENYRLATALNIRGTPAFIIGDVFIPGSISLEKMKEIVEQVRNNRKEQTPP